MKHFAVFGTHPRLSLAEFKAARPKAKNIKVDDEAITFEDPDWNGQKMIDLLGGTVKLGEVVLEVPISKLDERMLAKVVLENPRADKIVFGLSFYGGLASIRKKIEKLPIRLKRELKDTGRHVRWMTSEHGKSPTPAAVAKLDLTDKGYDFVLIINNDRVAIGLTTHVQDADAWSLRDYGRPARKAKAGMLPPKLARMMVNLAELSDGGVLLDPFCGSGTILMEAALATQAEKIIGSDIDAKQIKDTNANLDWLVQQNIFKNNERKNIQTFVSDIRKLDPRTSDIGPRTIDVVVTEGYLGPPLKGHETNAGLEKSATEITNLWRDTFQVLHPLLKDKGRVVCIWPAYKTKLGSARVDLSEDKELLKKFNILTPEPMIYHRQGQHIKRQIMILEKKG
ncbi:methyltransferase domain-containing protein [Patescibacteria group bacterium]|nr:methyltransferase domain-containing protein [Patescibacteria group bacterium]